MAAIPKFANRFGAQNDANLGTGTLEHFVQEWEPAFVLAHPFIVCSENWHYVLEDRPVFASDTAVRLPPVGFVLPKVHPTLPFVSAEAQGP
jgi:hypothetical protein